MLNELKSSPVDGSHHLCGLVSWSIVSDSLAIFNDVEQNYHKSNYLLPYLLLSFCTIPQRVKLYMHGKRLINVSPSTTNVSITPVL